MAGSTLIRSNEFPLVEVSAEGMVLPQVIGAFNLRNYPSLLIRARNKNLPYVFAVMRRIDEPDKLFNTGVVASFESVSDVHPVLWVKGIYRAQLMAIKRKKSDEDPWMAVIGESINDDPEECFIEKDGEEIVNPKFEIELLGLMNNLRRKTKKLVDRCDEMGEEAYNLEGICEGWGNLNLLRRNVLDDLIWNIVYTLPIDNEKKQYMIEARSLHERISRCIDLLDLTRLIMEADSLIEEEKEYERNKQPSKNKKRKRRVPISKGPSSSSTSPEEESFNTDDPTLQEKWERYQKIRDSLDPIARKAFIEDFRRLSNLNPQQSDWNVYETHLSCILDLYSLASTPQERDLDKAEQILDDSHYGLPKAKARIYNHLATKLRNPKGKGPIICFVGPPGVGKTSLGKAIAECLGRKFIRLSLGGVKDEAEIRGHRRTYIGALPGRIIRDIIRCGSKSPVYMLDEVDKLTNDMRGDPSSALLEVLDPEQNHSFQDHYIEAPFDLSDVLFLCTANVASRIQAALFNRMTPIHISGYTEEEKIQISDRFLVKKIADEIGLSKDNIEIKWQDDDPHKIFSKIIRGYTREAGIRRLEQNMQQILESHSREHMKSAVKSSEILITEDSVERILGIPAYSNERVRETEVGESVGLVVTGSGNGDIIYVQAQFFRKGTGEKGISQTGQLREILREANKNALTVVKNLLEENEEIFKKFQTHSIHLSIPDGATPKDGPSAGITMAVALYSELTGKSVKPFVAMTGELTIKGRIRSIGGVREKVLAAYRDGIKEVILPASNKRDYEQDVKQEIKDSIHFHFVENIEQVLRIVLLRD